MRRSRFAPRPGAVRLDEAMQSALNACIAKADEFVSVCPTFLPRGCNILGAQNKTTLDHTCFPGWLEVLQQLGLLGPRAEQLTDQRIFLLRRTLWRRAGSFRVASDLP